MSESTLTLNDFLSAVSKRGQYYDVGSEYQPVEVTQSEAEKYPPVGMSEAEKLIHYQVNAPKYNQFEGENEKILMYAPIDLLNKQFETRIVTKNDPEPTVSGCYEEWDLDHQQSQTLRSDNIISNSIDVRWISDTEQMINKQTRTQIGIMSELERPGGLSKAEQLVYDQVKTTNKTPKTIDVLNSLKAEQRVNINNVFKTSIKMNNSEPINPFPLNSHTCLKNASDPVNVARPKEASEATQLLNSRQVEPINLVDDQIRSNKCSTSSYTLHAEKSSYVTHTTQRKTGKGDEDNIHQIQTVLDCNSPTNEHVYKTEAKAKQNGYESNPILNICRENCLRKLLGQKASSQYADKLKLHRSDSSFNVASLPVDSPDNRSSQAGIADTKPAPHGQIRMGYQQQQNDAELISQVLRSKVSQPEVKEQAKLIPRVADARMDSEIRRRDTVESTPQTQLGDGSQSGQRAAKQLSPVVMANVGSPSMETYFKLTQPQRMRSSESGKLVYDEKIRFESTFNQEAAKLTQHSHKHMDKHIIQRGANQPRAQRSLVSQSGKLYPKPSPRVGYDSESAKGDANQVAVKLLMTGSEPSLRDATSTPIAQISTASQSFIKTQTIETQLDNMHFESGVEPSEESDGYSHIIYSDKEPEIKISESFTTSNVPVFDMVTPENTGTTKATSLKQYREAETQFSDTHCRTKGVHDTSMINEFKEKGIQTQTRTSNNNTQTLKGDQFVNAHNKSTSFSSVKYSKYSSTDAARTIQSSSSFLFNNSEDHTVMDRRFTIPLEVYQNKTLPAPEVVIPQYVNIHNQKPASLNHRRKYGPSPVLFRGEKDPRLPVFQNIPPVQSLSKPWPEPEVKQSNAKRVQIREPAVSNAYETPEKVATPSVSQSSNEHPFDLNEQGLPHEENDPSDTIEYQYVYAPEVVKPVNGEFLGYFLMGVAAMILIVTVATLLGGGLYIGPLFYKTPGVVGCAVSVRV